MKLTRFSALACSLSLTLLLGACSGSSSSQFETSAASQQQAAASSQGEQAGILSAFSTTSLDGSNLDQSMLEGYGLTMVNVWATYCKPCLSEMPDLGELADEYRDEGVQIVGLVSDVLNSDGSFSQEQLDTARDIVAETGADYPHLLPSQDLYGLLSQIYAVPTTFFVDSEGRQVGSAYLSAKEKDEWAEIIESMMEEAGL